MLQVLDAAAVRRWADSSVDLLQAHRAELDRTNVFPVPDGDTGTNLVLTLRSGAEALGRALAGPDHPAATSAPAITSATVVGLATALADGALRGARGNSGVIVSQLFRGFAEVFSEFRADGGAPVDGPVLARALCRADELARVAVSRPVQGTVLSVLRAAARAAESVVAGPGAHTLGEVVTASVDGARDALADTPRQLPALARAGVVDSGGWGLALVLAALAEVVTGRPTPEVVSVEYGYSRTQHSRGRDRDALTGQREAGSAEYDYEVMYLLEDGSEASVAGLRTRLDELGDSVAVVGSEGPGGGLWNVHVHCTDIGAAVEAGIAAGRPHRITVLRFADQVGGPPAPGAGRFPLDRAVVTVVAGEPVAELVRSDGVAVLVSGLDQRPGAPEIAAAVAGSRARHVTVLPNDVELNLVAEEAAERARAGGQDVVVVPTSSVLQGLAALAVHDPSRRAGDDVVAMAEAAAATRTGVVQIALTDALTWVGRCRAGDVLGLVDGEVVLIERELVDAARQLVDRMLTMGGELVTVLLGANQSDELGGLLERFLRRTHPEVEVVVYRGGPADRPVQLGVE